MRVYVDNFKQKGSETALLKQSLTCNQKTTSIMITYKPQKTILKEKYLDSI